jgi:hypothetical protein
MKAVEAAVDKNMHVYKSVVVAAELVGEAAADTNKVTAIHQYENHQQWKLYQKATLTWKPYGHIPNHPINDRQRRGPVKTPLTIKEKE